MDFFELPGLPPGQEAAWVDEFLRGPGGNAALADGLKLAPPRWEGPLLVPLADLHRCAGPEPEMEYVQDAVGWEGRGTNLSEFLRGGGKIAPLIAQRRPTGLSVRDGNHRLEALRCLGADAAWVLVWQDLPEPFPCG